MAPVEISSLQVSQRITRTGGVQIICVPSEPYAPKPPQSGFFGVAVGLTALGVTQIVLATLG